MSYIGKSPVPEHDTHAVLDSSKISAFQDCPRGYFFRYVLGLEPRTVSPHLAFGSAWHEAMEHLLWNLGDVSGAYAGFVSRYFAEISKDPFFTDNRNKNPETALAALTEYVGKWYQDKDETLFTEIAGTVPINEEGQLIYVKLDSVRRNDKGQVYSLEHKTTGRLSESWKEKWNWQFQVGTYSFFLWSWLDDPSLFNGVTINGAVFRAKDRDFLRIPVKHDNAWLEGWVWQANHWIEQINWNMEALAEHDESNRVLNAFPINSGSCEKFGCKFPGLCAARANPLQKCHTVPAGYDVSFWDPRARETKSKTVVHLEETGRGLS